MPNDRLLIVGWDGADWEILDDLMSRGELPHLSEAIRHGARGELESTYPTHSWAAWPTFLTGLHPSGHGVFDFVERDPTDPQRRVPVSSAAIGAATFLEVLSEAGHEVRAANIPVTFPPLKVRGRLIAGAAIPPRASFVHPPDWGRQLQDVAPFPLNGMEWARSEHAQEKLIDEAVQLIERRTASYEALLEGRWSVAVCVYLAPDRLQHPFGACLLPTHPNHDRAAGSALAERLRGAYRTLDRQIPRLRAAAGDDATFVFMSDHGFRPVTRVVDIDRMLEALGLAASHMRADAVRSLRRSPPARALSRSVLGRALKARIRRPSTLDWRGTIAYQATTGSGVSLNVRGREAHGVVDPNDYDAVRSKVADAVLGFEDPETGEHPIEAVKLREELPPGPYLDRAPDLLLRPAPLWLFAGCERVTSSTSWPTGTHRRMGVIVASGGRTVPGDLGRRSLADLAPTALAFHGFDSGPTDGRAIEQIAGMGGGGQSGGAPTRVAAARTRSFMNEDEERFVEQHLRDLGYLE